MNKFYLIILFFIAISLYGCQKHLNSPAVEITLENSPWQPSSTNDNIAAIEKYPILYHPWQQCDMEDTYIFKNGLFSFGNSRCENIKGLLAKYNNKPYTYDPIAKTITIGDKDDSLTVTILDLSQTQLLLGITVSLGTGYNYLVYMFKRKQA